MFPRVVARYKGTLMASAPRYKWEFRARFRRHSFGWRSQPAVKRIKEAVSEIRKAARKDPVLGAEGAVLFLEKISPAIEQVDGSSGSIGTAVNRAIDTLVPIIASAPAEEDLRDQWMERLSDAVDDDDMPYLEWLIDRWGELCGNPECASRWADRFLPTVRQVWSPEPELGGGYYKGTSACLSALYTSGRYEEILELLEHCPHPFWSYRKWGVRALAGLGRKAEALRYAEESRGVNEPDHAISRACEEVLLSSGMAEEAYKRYSFEANRKTTYLATFRAIVKKYPGKDPAEILEDLAARTPDEEGKWFAAAKSAGLYDQAILLANRSPGDPCTLTRAARDMAEAEPLFAVNAGLAALRWLVAGYGYEITNFDVRAAYDHTIQAARNLGRTEEVREKIRELVSRETFGERFVTKVLGRELGLG